MEYGGGRVQPPFSQDREYCRFVIAGRGYRGLLHGPFRI